MHEPCTDVCACLLSVRQRVQCLRLWASNDMQVYLTAGSAREDRWADASDRLKASVVSFRLV